MVMTDSNSRRSSESGKYQATHGESRTKLYNIWYNMLRRCYNPSINGYMNYGGRGITVCNEWHTFEGFRDWALSSGYSIGLSIERINNDVGYCPDNCTWIPRSKQQSNKRNVVYVIIGDERKHLTDWSKVYGIGMQTVSRRIHAGWNPVDAITIPASKKYWNRWTGELLDR